MRDGDQSQFVPYDDRIDQDPVNYNSPPDREPSLPNGSHHGWHKVSTEDEDRRGLFRYNLIHDEAVLNGVIPFVRKNRNGWEAGAKIAGKVRADLTIERKEFVEAIRAAEKLLPRI